MDVRFSPAEEEFRLRARSWLEAHKPKDPPPETDLGARREFDLAWQREMYDAGWAGIAWPERYGGRGATLSEQLVWYEEYARARVPEPATLFVGLNHGGPTLIACGTEAQKEFHLPRILRGEVVWCQGFSEPGAGSDLASLQTRAVVDGDELVVSGQKVWTSFAQIADFQELLVRTDAAAPKHAGISWVICPMDAKGITVRPIRTMASHLEFCEVFYDDVRIPIANVVGELNDGWRVAQSTLGFERGTAFLAHQVHLARQVDELIELARMVPLGGSDGAPDRNGRTALDDAEIGRRLALARAEVEMLRAMAYRSVSRTARAGTPSADGSVIRLFYSELQQRVFALAMDILGPAILEWDASEGEAGEAGAVRRSMRETRVFRYLLSFQSTIAAGTKDIQRNIIGERLLGLPREPSRARD
jgi:alkylation response protein AidB-like acyl-CoA dehydrogenase